MSSHHDSGKSEKLTRQEMIDFRLRLAGWNVDDRTQVIPEFYTAGINMVQEEKAGYGKKEFCDYVLLGKDGKPVAVVEAKKSSVDAEVGREQARQYCLSLEAKTGRLPFCFYTNGQEIFFWDIGNYPPRKVMGFPRLEDLERFAYLRANRKNLAEEFINTQIAGRDYQVMAIRSILEAIESRKKRFLLVMATGTGKTRTCIAIVDALMRAGWVERTLFLVDRVELREQALDAFKEYLPNEPRWPNENEKNVALDRRIYVSTYPAMLNIIHGEDSPFSPHFFDLVVIDESHRSIYNTYQEILTYFNTITLGLTATPTAIIDHNTFELFDEEDELPTYAFTYEEAVGHVPPYLCDFQVMKIVSRFQEKGINARTISLEDQLKLIREGKEVEEINYEGSELEKTVTNRGTNALIVREFMEECIKDATGVLPGKTIFFCSTKAHARRIEQIFDSLYPEYAGELARVMVSDDPRVHGKGGLLYQFKNSDLPRIAISVDMLDTGIDIREVVNLVFAKPVYSYTKFWQMIGRGTRLLEEDKLKPWCTQKDVFLILDCWDNFEYFKLNPKGKELIPQVPLPVKLVEMRLVKLRKALELHEMEIVEKEAAKLREQIAALPAQSIVVRDAEKSLDRLNEAGFWENLTFEKIEFISREIQPLFRAFQVEDAKAMRFERDVVELGLALMNKDKKKFETLKDSIVERISELPLTVNVVAARKDFIRQCQTPHFWNTISEEKLQELLVTIAPLMKFHETVPMKGMVHYNLKDVVSQKEYVEFGPAHEAIGIAKYRELVEQKVQEALKVNPILLRLKTEGHISETEAGELAEQLSREHPYITVDLLRKAYNNPKAKFEQFIRHILGMERLESFPEMVAGAFDVFIREHGSLNSKQLRFLDLLRRVLTEKGRVEKKDLIGPPFTRVHPDGVLAVFSAKEIDEIIMLIQRIAA